MYIDHTHTQLCCGTTASRLTLRRAPILLILVMWPHYSSPCNPLSRLDMSASPSSRPFLLVVWPNQEVDVVEHVSMGLSRLPQDSLVLHACSVKDERYAYVLVVFSEVWLYTRTDSCWDQSHVPLVLCYSSHFNKGEVLFVFQPYLDSDLPI